MAPFFYYAAQKAIPADKSAKGMARSSAQNVKTILWPVRDFPVVNKYPSENDVANDESAERRSDGGAKNPSPLWFSFVLLIKQMVGQVLRKIQPLTTLLEAGTRRPSARSVEKYHPRILAFRTLFGTSKAARMALTSTKTNPAGLANA